MNATKPTSKHVRGGNRIYKAKKKRFQGWGKMNSGKEDESLLRTSLQMHEHEQIVDATEQKTTLKLNLWHPHQMPFPGT